MPARQRIRSVVLALLVFSTALNATAAQTEDPFERINESVQEIRELELLQPINLSTRTRAELQEETAQDLETDYPAVDRQNDQRVLVAFGLMDPNQDIGQIYVDLLGEQIAGYYDPETDEMVVVSDDAPGDELSATNEVTYAHELVHALQDQHFNLESFIDQRIEGSDDESLAITSLIEGDATAAQIQYVISNPELIDDLSGQLTEGDSGSGALEAAPPIVSATLLFPYEEGQVFVDEIMSEGGWEAVNAAYQSPPASTEQILHPDKYRQGEAPIPVIVPDIAAGLGGEWTTFDTNTMGEFQTSIVLNQGDVSARQAEQAAEGWGGDSYTVVGTQDQDVIVWNSVWDTEEDATEFAESLAVRESDRLGVSPETDDTTTTTTIASDGALARIIVEGTSVSYVFAPDQPVLDQVDAIQDAATPVS